jgi:hypothetical protein
MNAIEKAHALLALRGKGATLESVKQMSNIYAEDTDITPDVFVTPKFEAAKAITAFGGYAVYLGLATEEQVINQREVYGEKYSSLDFSLEKDAFSDSVDVLALAILTSTAEETRKDKANGNFATVKVNALLKIISVLTPTLLAPTSTATKDALRAGAKRILHLLDYQVVSVPQEVKEEVLV